MPISEVYNCDCLEFMKGLPDNYFDLCIADPDYGLDKKISGGGTWAAKYKGFDGSLGGKPSKDLIKELNRVSKNQIIWGGNYFIDMLYPSRCFLVWDKKARLETLADCEMAWTSFDKNAKIFTHPRNTSEKRVHICQKPIALYAWILDNYAKVGDKIFDPFLGSGSSRIAAYKKGFDFYACELDKDFYNAQEERFRSECLGESRQKDGTILTQQKLF